MTFLVISFSDFIDGSWFGKLGLVILLGVGVFVFL